MEMAENAATGLLGQIGGMIFGGAQDRRQLRQQEKLQNLQIRGNKEMLDYSNAAQEAMQMRMWDKTNYSEQIKQLEKAGMSPGMLYGGSGGGGATMGGGGASGSVSGASAGDPNSAMGMGLQMASQLALQKAQKENIEADTKNKEAEAINKTTEGEIKTATKDSAIKQIIESANKTMSEAIIKANEQTISDRTMQEQLTQVVESTLNKILTNQNLKIENKKKEAETAIKEFEANMTKNGMSANTPWWVKFIADQTEKLGLGNLLK